MSAARWVRICPVTGIMFVAGGAGEAKPLVKTAPLTMRRVSGAAGQAVTYRQLTPGLTAIPLPSGLYIVRLTDGTTVRVVVRP